MKHLVNGRSEVGPFGGGGKGVGLWGVWGGQHRFFAISNFLASSCWDIGKLFRREHLFTIIATMGVLLNMDYYYYYYYYCCLHFFNYYYYYYCLHFFNYYYYYCCLHFFNYYYYYY